MSKTVEQMLAGIDLLLEGMSQDDLAEWHDGRRQLGLLLQFQHRASPFWYLYRNGLNADPSQIQFLGEIHDSTFTVDQWGDIFHIPEMPLNPILRADSAAYGHMEDAMRYSLESMYRPGIQWLETADPTMNPIEVLHRPPRRTKESDHQNLYREIDRQRKRRR